jgi:hypothetical protein
MKKTLLFVSTALLLFSPSCKKETTPEPLPPTPSGVFLQAFYDRNKPQTESFSFVATSGGTFTTQKGTRVTVPANAFINPNGSPYTGTVTVFIMDIYKKSDMLFADMHTATKSGGILESAGEFNIKAVNTIGVPLDLSGSVAIAVEQPLQPQQQMQQGMIAFIAEEDTIGLGWAIPDSTQLSPLVTAAATNYIFDLYQFSVPLEQGTWCNSDQPAFGSTPQTLLNLTGNDDASEYATDVFLIFSDVNSMIHVYRSLNNTFQYPYAPQGQNCTLVAIGAKDDKLFASFVPITIGTAIQTVNFTLSEISEANFKTQLDALN